MTQVSHTLGRRQLRQTTYSLSITVKILEKLRFRACVGNGSVNILKAARTPGAMGKSLTNS